MPKMLDACMSIPQDLQGLGKEAAEIVVAYIRSQYKETFGETEEPDTGGCKMFYTPKAWKERGEQYGRESLVIVVHDGGDHAPYFNWDYQCYEMIEGLNKALAKIGCFTEQCTTWYSAIYKI
jgi:hypothetical protein